MLFIGIMLLNIMYNEMMPHINSSPQFNVVDCPAAHIFDLL